MSLFSPGFLFCQANLGPNSCSQVFRLCRQFSCACFPAAVQLKLMVHFVLVHMSLCRFWAKKLYFCYVLITAVCNVKDQKPHIYLDFGV